MPNSTVSCNGDTFEINCNKDKKVNLGTSSYVFRAPTRGDNQAWYSYLYGITEEFKTVPLLEKTESNYTATPIHRDLPPLPSSVLPIEPGQERRAIEGPPQTQNRQLGTGEQVNTGQQQEHAYIQENTGNNQPDYRQDNTGNDQHYYRQDSTGLDQQQQKRAQPVLSKSNTITGDNQLANITAAGQSATTANLGTEGGDYASGSQTGNYNSGSQTGNYTSTGQTGNHTSDIQTGNNTLNTQDSDHASGNQAGNYVSAIKPEQYEGQEKSLNESKDDNKFAPTLNTQAKKDAFHSQEGTNDYTDNSTTGIYQNNGFLDKNGYANNNDKFNSADNLTSDEDVYAGGGKTERSEPFNQRLSPTEDFGREHRAVDAPDVSSPTNPHYDIRSHQSKIAEHFDDDDDDSFTLSRHDYHSSKQGEPGL